MEKIWKKVAVITGASSGMGREFAKLIDRELTCIDEIWLIARRRDRLEEVRDEIHKPSLIICSDVSEDSFADYYRKMLKQNKTLDQIYDIFAGKGISETYPNEGNTKNMEITANLYKKGMEE